jgi:hypothetical protein
MTIFSARKELNVTETNRILNASEAMTRLSCRATKFWSIVATGVLDARKLGGATVFPVDAIDRFIANLPPR